MTTRKKTRSHRPRRFSGERLLEARERAGLRREDLVARAACSFSSLYLWETGRVAPHANALARLADVLDIAIDDLFDKEAG